MIPDAKKQRLKTLKLEAWGIKDALVGMPNVPAVRVGFYMQLRDLLNKYEIKTRCYRVEWNENSGTIDKMPTIITGDIITDMLFFFMFN